MGKYWVNNHTDANPNNDHKVHKEGCPVMPDNKTYLDLHNNCDSALHKARAYHSSVDGCIQYIPECHDR